MKEQRKLKKTIENTLRFFVKSSANSTTSGTIFQPVVPEKLKKFSRFNDK